MEFKKMTREAMDTAKSKLRESLPKSETVRQQRARQKEKKKAFAEFMDALDGASLEEIEKAKEERRQKEIEKQGIVNYKSKQSYERQAMIMDNARKARSIKSLQTKERFFEVLEISRNESTARLNAGIYYATFLSWMQNKEFRERYEDIKRRLKDKAEEVIANSLDENNVETAKFVLKHYKIASSDWSESQTINVSEAKAPSWCEEAEEVLAAKKLKEFEAIEGTDVLGKQTV